MNKVSIIILSLIVALVLTVLIIRFCYKKIKSYKFEVESLEHEIKEKDLELAKLAVIDPLTDVFNRNRLDSELQMELARVSRSHKSMGVIMVGIDSLKSINESHAHNVGDFVVREFAIMLKDSIRKTDVLGRWRGDKFLIIYSNISNETLLDLGEKLRIAAEEKRYTVAGSVTASFGATIYTEGDDEIKLVSRADSALANAKKSGKNRVALV